VLFTSCERLFIDDGFSEDPVHNFDYLWEEVDEHYAFFELKKVDWDSVYRVYRPQIQPGMSDIALFNVCAEMLNELQDGHVNLSSDFNISRFNFSASTEKNFNFKLLQENYIGYDYYSTGPLINTSLKEGKVGYIRYSSFTNNIDKNDLNFVFQRFQNTEGLVLDLRSNFGGNQRNVEMLIGGFIQGKNPVLYSSMKTGENPDDFADPTTIEFQASVENTYSKPVMLLVNRESYSATSFFTTLARQLDQVTVIGDTTGGGMGIPTGGELPNGWNYRFSGSRTLDNEGNNFENGVPPDIYVIQDFDDLFDGVDTMLEKALEELGH
jgi:C-terminal processing protease CtpA/Prc